MKKRLLFVNNHLRTGGAENSLISLLNQIDFSKYEVDLLLYHKDGSYLDRLPKEVNVINSGIDEEYFYPFFKSIYKSSIRFKVKSFGLKIYSNYSTKLLKRNFDQINARVMRIFLRNYVSKEYDVAIAYKHIYSNFILQNIKAERKIAYVHSDYISMGLQAKYDKPYLNKLDIIATVSEGCRISLLKNFPDLENKIVIAPNITAPSLIKDMAEEDMEENSPQFNGYKLVTIARLDFIKGIDLAIQASSLLKKEKYSFKWYIIGGGNKEKYQHEINKLGLENDVILLGEKKNPYPYIKNAHIYIQPSRTEGKSIAIEEAKVLKKPIIVTGYPTVYDQIQNLQNGIIVPISSIGLLEGITKLINNQELQERLIEKLTHEKNGNENDVNIFYNMVRL